MYDKLAQTVLFYTYIRISRWWWNVIDVEVLSRAPVIFAPLFLRPIVKPALVWSRRKIAFNVPSYNLNSVSRWIASSTLSDIRSTFAESKKRAATKSIVEQLPIVRRCLCIENSRNCSPLIFRVVLLRPLATIRLIAIPMKGWMIALRSPFTYWQSKRSRNSPVYRSKRRFRSFRKFASRLIARVDDHSA